jgi:hypothetical protein
LRLREKPSEIGVFKVKKKKIVVFVLLFQVAWEEWNRIGYEQGGRVWKEWKWEWKKWFFLLNLWVNLRYGHAHGKVEELGFCLYSLVYECLKLLQRDSR